MKMTYKAKRNVTTLKHILAVAMIQIISVNTVILKMLMRWI